MSQKPKREEWREIDGYPYAVSNHGRVKRIRGGYGNAKVGRILKPHTDEDGYKIVALCRDGAVRYVKVHRLVCAHFNGGSIECRFDTRHLDGHPSHNWPRNLVWGTRLENAHDRARHGSQVSGERSPRSKLTKKLVEELRAKHAAAQVGRQRVPRGLLPILAREYGLSVHGVATIVSGRGYN